MIIRTYPEIPSYSSQDCQIQIVQLLEHFPRVKNILVLGAMLGAYPAAFAGTFPDAQILAVDRWQGEDCGLNGLSNSVENCQRYLDVFPNIRLLKIDYTAEEGIKKLPRDFDFIYIGGPIIENVDLLLSHFSSSSLIAGVMYAAAETIPASNHHDRCQINSERMKLKDDLIRFAKKSNRLLLPCGCYNWLLTHQQDSSSVFSKLLRF